MQNSNAERECNSLFSANDSEERKVNLRGANGSPKTAQLCDQPASQAAVHNPASWLELASRIAGSGRTPDPLIAKRKE